MEPHHRKLPFEERAKLHAQKRQQDYEKELQRRLSEISSNSQRITRSPETSPSSADVRGSGTDSDSLFIPESPDDTVAPGDRDTIAPSSFSSFSGRAVPNVKQGTKTPKSILTNNNKSKMTENQPTSFTSSLEHSRPNASSVSAGSSTTFRSISPQDCPLPDWYAPLNVTRKAAGQESSEDRNKQTFLNRFRERIVEDPSRHDKNIQEYFDQIRDDLHRLEHTPLDAIRVKKSKLLEPRGLQKLFLPLSDGTFAYEHDIRADAKALRLKWCRGDFDPDIMRGIDDIRKPGKRLSARTMSDYPNRVSANFFGRGDLVNGQWWPTQLCALRDGCHGEKQAGIHGRGGEGAYSIVLSGSSYDDIDEGSTIRYCGTKNEDGGSMTDDTKLLLSNIKTQKPVRVLRTASLPPGNPYRPEMGIRYDGLYRVIDWELLNAKISHYRFLLKREDGEDPIRYEGKAKRPTQDEINAYGKYRKLTGRP